MSYTIEVISLGEDSYAKIAEAVQILNSVQREFRFELPPPRLRSYGASSLKQEYHTEDVWEFLKEYRIAAKGNRQYLIAVVNGALRSKRYSNLFGSHDAPNGFAVVTLRDYHNYADSHRSFLCYFFIRYTLSFIEPNLKGHLETRNCFFDFKGDKRDLEKSMKSGAFCPDCAEKLARKFNPDVKEAIDKMIEVMKAQHATSIANLPAESVKGITEIGIITIREDEFEAVINQFEFRRTLEGKNRLYEHVRLRTKAQTEIGVAIGRAPEQGQGPSQSVAYDMIAELEPRWILLVGIAGGLPDSDYTLGDVILASRIHDFAVSATLEGREPEYQQQGGPVQVEVEKLITHLPAIKKSLGNWNTSDAIQMTKPAEQITEISDGHFYGDEPWREKVFLSLRSHFPQHGSARGPVFKVAPVMTANTLVKDTKLADQWKKSARHAAAIEMELGGIYLAARYAGDRNTRVLAIRGISDIIGYKRRPEWTEFACRSAASFARALLESGLLQ